MTNLHINKNVLCEILYQKCHIYFNARVSPFREIPLRSCAKNRQKKSNKKSFMINVIWSFEPDVKDFEKLDCQNLFNFLGFD